MGKLHAKDGVEIRHRHWPAEQPRAQVLIIHGMAEHIDRYDWFAKKLNAEGLNVLGMEVRGHGNGAQKLGWFAKEDGWRAVVGDAFALIDHMRGEASELPVFVFGHSMGTVFARVVIMDERGSDVAACVLSGVTVDQPVRRNIAPLMTSIIGLFCGSDKPSKLLADMTFGTFNKAFAPNRTEYDWLSRDAEQVDKYVADPLCGYDCSPSLMGDVAKAILHTLKAKNEKQINCPVLIAVGAEDPVGGETAARFLEKRWKALGKAADVRIYRGARHEILNETNREEVAGDAVGFFLKHC